jgi:opacity protein-like surface antigen
VSVLVLYGEANADTSDKTFYEPDSSAVYTGLAYSSFAQSIKGIALISTDDIKADDRLPMFQVGYKYNSYLSVEGRYWFGVSNIHQSGGRTPGSYGGDVDSWGIYAKPTLPLNENIDVYLLLGYGSSSINYGVNKWDTDGFSWGIGFETKIVDNLSLFADYVSVASADNFSYRATNGSYLSNINADIDVYSLNVGLNYKFKF